MTKPPFKRKYSGQSVDTTPAARFVRKLAEKSLHDPATLLLEGDSVTMNVSFSLTNHRSYAYCLSAISANRKTAPATATAGAGIRLNALQSIRSSKVWSAAWARCILLNATLCVLFALLSRSLLAQGLVYLRTPGTNSCNVIGATNTTPIQITVASASSCGLTNGAGIVIVDVEGNTAANINAKPNQLVRQVANLSGNTFTILDAAGINIPGNGTYSSNTGRLGLATAYTLKPSPIAWLDGSGGTLTTAQSNNTSTGRANTNNPVYVDLTARVNSYVSSYANAWGVDETFLYQTENAAIRWLADGNSGALTAAVWGLSNPDQYMVPVCDETSRQCGNNGSNYLNYSAGNLGPLATSYSIMRNQLTSAERGVFLDYILNDLPYANGGIDTTTHTKMTFAVPSGTLAITQGSATITGSGTSFTSAVKVGDIIMIPNGGFGIYMKVVSIGSDTTITAAAPAPNTQSGITGWWDVPAWTTANYGLIWYEKHADFAILCGGSQCHNNYPTTGGQDFLPNYPQNGAGVSNLSIQYISGWFQTGLATCSDDVRGCLLAEGAYEELYDFAYSFCLATWTGFNQSGTITRWILRDRKSCRQ